MIWILVVKYENGTPDHYYGPVESKEQAGTILTDAGWVYDEKDIYYFFVDGEITHEALIEEIIIENLEKLPKQRGRIQ